MMDGEQDKDRLAHYFQLHRYASLITVVMRPGYARSLAALYRDDEYAYDAIQPCSECIASVAAQRFKPGCCPP